MVSWAEVALGSLPIFALLITWLTFRSNQPSKVRRLGELNDFRRQLKRDGDRVHLVVNAAFLQQLRTLFVKPATSSAATLAVVWVLLEYLYIQAVLLTDLHWIAKVGLVGVIVATIWVPFQALKSASDKQTTRVHKLLTQLESTALDEFETRVKADSVEEE